MHYFTRKRIAFYALAAFFTTSIGLFLFLAFPTRTEKQEVFLAQGTVPREISSKLESSKVVRSSFFLHIILKLRGTAGALVPGNYLFEGRQSVFRIASRITNGEFGTDQMKVTIPEGSTNAEVTYFIKEKFPTFDEQKFLAETTNKQGYLFPETYYLLSTSTEAIVVQLTDSFDYHVRELQSDALMESKEWRDIVTMASILEEEANTPADFKIVSGILWKRISIGMALQVDVAPVTYERPGFPPFPLSNPGLATLEAALYPIETQYFYYLTGKDGLMHYAVTFDEHKKNIETYLR